MVHRPTDPRDPPAPERLLHKDRQSFDKGHIVRREDVAWGTSYEELRRANGDTYHVTNCSPQIESFNRSRLRRALGAARESGPQAGENRAVLPLCGARLPRDDRLFLGVDDAGPARVADPPAVLEDRRGEDRRRSPDVRVHARPGPLGHRVSEPGVRSRQGLARADDRREGPRGAASRGSTSRAAA